MKKFDNHLTGFVDIFIRSGNSEIIVKNKVFWDEFKKHIHERYNQLASVSYSTETERWKHVHTVKLFGVNFIYMEDEVC